MIELICLVVGAVIGFITGALVYRNNAEEVEAKVADVKEDVETVKEAVEKIKE